MPWTTSQTVPAAHSHSINEHHQHMARPCGYSRSVDIGLHKYDISWYWSQAQYRHGGCNGGTVIEHVCWLISWFVNIWPLVSGQWHTACTRLLPAPGQGKARSHQRSKHSSRKRMKQGKKRKKSRFLDWKKRQVIMWAYRPKVLGLKTTLNQICCPLHITNAILYFNQQF